MTVKISNFLDNGIDLDNLSNSGTLSLLKNNASPDRPINYVPANEVCPKMNRVSFDDSVRVHKFPLTRLRDIPDNIDECEQNYLRWMTNPKLSIDDVKQDLRSIIQDHLRGDNAAYIELKRILSQKPLCMPDLSLRKCVIGLSGILNLLDRTCSDLVYSILRIDWLGRDESFYRLYIDLLSGLLPVHAGYCREVFCLLLSYFRNIPVWAGHIAGYAEVHNRELRHRIHDTIKHILNILPGATTILAGILEPCFPRDADPAKYFTDYAKNLLRMTKYAPELRGTVLSLLVSRVVSIDVKIQVDLDDLEDELAEVVADSLIEDERRFDESDSDSLGSEIGLDMDLQAHIDPMGDTAEVGNIANLRKLKNDVQKMDGILDLLFHHYHNILNQSDGAEYEDALDCLMGQFTTSVLPAYRSRHTQFLLFHFCQKSQCLIERFVNLCFDRIYDRTESTILRLAAAAYLSSFIARGANIPPEVVLRTFRLLGDQAEHVLNQTVEPVSQQTAMLPISNGGDSHKFTVYYGIIQALLYIFCFRWRDLLSDGNIDKSYWDYIDEKQDLPWYPGIREILAGKIFSGLNPLRVCNRDIVDQFAKVSSQLGFLHVYSLIKANEQSFHMLTPPFRNQSTRDSSNGSGLNPDNMMATTFELEAYFPFDPFKLPRSKRWITDYREWTGIAFLDDDEQTVPLPPLVKSPLVNLTEHMKPV